MHIPARPSARVRPADLLLSPLLLASLALLVANDWVLKPAFHDALTGKLSDFAGVAALALCLRALVPRRPLAACVLAGAAFALWKSPAAQPLIDAWNGLGWGRMGRVVDGWDLLALLVLPAAALYRPRPLALRRTRAMAPLAGAFCMLAFAATTCVDPDTWKNTPVPFPGPGAYAFDEAPDELLARIYALRLGGVGHTGPPEPLAGRAADTLAMRIASADSGRAEWTALVRVELRAGLGGEGSVLRLLDLEDVDVRVFSPDVVRFRFERQVVQPLRRGDPPPERLPLLRRVPDASPAEPRSPKPRPGIVPRS
jgi:hypothetical protein